MRDIEHRFCYNCRKETLQRAAPATDISVRWECTVCDDGQNEPAQP